MDSGTIIPIAGDSGIENLQRIQPTTNSGQRKRENPKRRPPKKTIRLVEDIRLVEEMIYTPDGHVEVDEHGLRIDISV